MSILNDKKTSHLSNPPGLDKLVYRFAKHESYLPKLLEEIIFQHVPAGIFIEKKPLLDLQTNSGNAITVLLDSWAIITDIISFYQERIINEGYIRTCKQDLSYQEILQLFNKQLRPAIASSGLIALTLNPEFSGKQFTVPSGIQVQNLPSPGVKSQVFESHVETQADALFNSLRILTTQIQTLSTATNQLFLKGQKLLVKEGQIILIVNESKKQNNQYSDWNMGTTIKTQQLLKQNSLQIEIELEKKAVNPIPSATDYKIYSFQKLTRLFGSRAPLFKFVSPEMKRKLSIVSSSFHLYEPLKNTWQPCGQGLTNPIAHQFWFAAKHFNYAVTSQGLFRTTNFKVWVPAQQGINSQKIYCIYSIYGDKHQNDLLFVGTDIGLFYSNDYGSHWTLRSEGLTNNYILSISHIEKILYAGTRKGLFYSSDNGESWHKAAGLHEHSIYAITTDQHKHLFVATEQGVIRTRGHAHGWEVWRHGIEKETVTALAWHDHKLFAVTSKGIYRSMKDGKDWHFAKNNLPEVPILDLCTDPKGNVYAATQQGLYCTTNYGEDWFSYGFNNTAVTTAAYTPEGLLIASVYHTKQPEQWPNFAISNNQIDLESFEPKITKGSWLILKNKENFLLTKVNQIEHLVRKDFMLTSTITRITPDVEIDPTLFDLTNTLVYLQTTPLILSNTVLTKPVTGNTLTLTDKLQKLPLPRDIIVQGIPIGEKKATAEIAKIVELDNSQQTTHLVLEKPLGNQYQRESVIIYANTLPIIQGETTLEVLNTKPTTTKTNAKFDLRKFPVAYSRDDSPQGYHSMVDIFVNDMTWKKVDNLYRQKSADLVYGLETNYKGKSKILFGNGNHGAPIPSGINNIKAVYTTLVDQPTEILENHVTILKRKLAPRVNSKQGLSINQKLDIPIQKITNPLAINNGIPAEKEPDYQGGIADRQYFTKRAVSLADITNTACQHPSIDKAIAIKKWSAKKNQQVVCLTIAAEIDYSPELLQEINQSLQNSLVTNIPLYIKPYKPLYFSISALISCKKGIDNQTKIIDHCTSLLKKEFGFAKTKLSQPVYASEIISKLQQVNNIVAIRLTAFHFVDEPESIQTCLNAESMKVTNTNFDSAELLLIDSNQINIKIQE